MNPAISWTLFLGIIGTIYVSVNGVPQIIKRAIQPQSTPLSDSEIEADSKSVASTTTSSKPGKSRAGGSNNNRRAEASINSKANASSSGSKQSTVAKVVGQAHDAVTTIAKEVNKTASSALRQHNEVIEPKNQKKAGSNKQGNQKNKVAAWYDKDAEAVPEYLAPRANDRPAISGEAWQRVPGTSEAGKHLAQQHFEKTRSAPHMTDDMLEPDSTFVARTLRIVPSGSPAQSAKQSRPKKQEEQPLTKKQRQNAAKKAKAQQEKELLRSEQEQALQKHKKNLEKQRIIELDSLAKQAAKKQSNGQQHAAGKSVWTDESTSRAGDVDGWASNDGSWADASSTVNNIPETASKQSTNVSNTTREPAGNANDDWETVTSGKRSIAAASSTVAGSSTSTAGNSSKAAGVNGHASNGKASADNNRFGKLIWE
ncbi:hypothetical protein PYCC9005_003066 [Savitreella phatthalungensis]